MQLVFNLQANESLLPRCSFISFTAISPSSDVLHERRIACYELLSSRKQQLDYENRSKSIACRPCTRRRKEVSKNPWGQIRRIHEGYWSSRAWCGGRLIRLPSADF